MAYVFLFLIIGLCDFNEDDYNILINDRQQAVGILKKELDKITRLLCESGKVYYLNKMPSIELLNWWTKHNADDKLKGR
jgi:hypothetical protein